jgi:BBSome-interacting protein 1
MTNQSIVIQEEKPFFIFCKPKLLPLKSMTLEKLEKMQRQAEEKAKQLMLQQNEQINN